MCPSVAPPQSLKQRVFACITKLSDRDTQSLGATELESIARSIDSNSAPVFLSCMNSIDASDKTPVRKQCVHILEILSQTHGNMLSPHLSKMLSSIVRRLRDPDTSVRSACVKSVSALATHITKPPFDSFLKPFSEALFTEQELNSQIGSALCLASVIDAVPDPDVSRLAKLLPKFEKLLKCQSFKAKAAVLTLMGSVINAGGASCHGALRNLVPCVTEFLSCEDWATRKASAEALVKLATVERDMLSEFKNECLKVFESRRFDKVKAVREIMNQLLDAWKQVPDVSDEVSPPPQSLTSSKENESDGRGRYLSGFKNSRGSVLLTPQLQNKTNPASRLTALDVSSATNALRRSSVTSSDRRASSGRSQNSVSNRPFLVCNIEPTTSRVGTYGSKLKERDTNIAGRTRNEKDRFLKPETKRVLFGRYAHDKVHKLSGLKTGSSRVVQCPEETIDSIGLTSDAVKDTHMKNYECDDLSLMRNQLVQIEKQQSRLLDLCQKFIGSSQNRMRTLETCVHGLELALDEISHDLAVSSGRMFRPSFHRSACFLLPGAEFLRPKFWRKAPPNFSTSRFSTSSSYQSSGSAHSRLDNDASAQASNFSVRMFRQHTGGFIVNPLAEIQSDLRVF